jgi:hypothetical protein
MFNPRNFVFVALTTLFLGLGGCAKGGADKIIGKWTVDVDALSNMDEFKKMPEDQRKMALDMAKGMMSSMEFEFTKDALKVSMMGQTKEGTYTVKSAEGDKIVIVSKEKDKDGKDGKEEEITIDASGDKLVLHMGKDEFPLKKK